MKNHLERDFSTSEPDTKRVTYITYHHTSEGWLYLCTMLDLFSNKILGWSMSDVQERHLVLSALLMACWQRANHDPVVLHSDHGMQFTCVDYQRFPLDKNITSRMCDVVTAAATQQRKASSG